MAIILDGSAGVTTPSVNSASNLVVGNINYTDTGIISSFASSVAGYNQVIVQNTSNNSGASANFNISNDVTTANTNFGEIGINSSTFTGTGSFSQANNVYLASASSDLVIGTYSAKPIRFVVNNGASDSMTIDSSGNLLVGVSSKPGSLGNSYAYVTQGVSVVNSGSTTAFFQVYNSNAGTDLKTWRMGNNDNTGALVWQTINDAYSSGTERMRIDSSCNVGIGTSSPAGRLHVSTTGSDVEVRSATTTANYATFRLKNSTNDYSMQIRTDQSNAWVLRDETAGANRMLVDTSGSVMIGTTSPGGKLTVAGPDSSGSNNALYVKNANNNLLFQARDDGWINLGNASVSPYNNTTPNGANMYIATDASVQRSTSSLKYKKNVVDARYGLADVLKLRAVNYQSKNDFDGDKLFGGLIAEEVEEAGLIEFVQYASDGTPDALAYGQMVAMAFKAIQELKSINDTQAETINALTTRIEALEKK